MSAGTLRWTGLPDTLPGKECCLKRFLTGHTSRATSIQTTIQQIIRRL